jgi:hypothetical protein
MHSVVGYVGGSLAPLLPMDDVGKLCVMSAGLRLFVRHKRTGTSFPFRIASEAVNFLAPLMTKRKFDIGLADARLLIRELAPKLEVLSEELRARLEGTEMGSVIWIVRCRMDGVEQAIPICGWYTPASAQFQVPKEQKEHFTMIFMEHCVDL